MRARFRVTWLVAATLAGPCAAQDRDGRYGVDLYTDQKVSFVRIDLRWPEIRFYQSLCLLSDPQPVADPGDIIVVDVTCRGENPDPAFSADDRSVRWPDPGQ